MSSTSAAREADARLRDVRAVPLDVLVDLAATELDSPLDQVIRDLPMTEENLAAFGQAP